MVDVSIKVGEKLFLWLKGLFQPTFRFWQSQQFQSIIGSHPQPDGSTLTQVDAEVLVANNTDQRLCLVEAFLDRPKIGEIDSVLFMRNNYIPARATVSVHILIIIRGTLETNGDVNATLCLVDNNGRKQRKKLNLRHQGKSRAL